MSLIRSTGWAAKSRAAVLERFRAAEGDWVDGEELEAVGGRDGLRRMRELRDEGYVIARRPDPRKGGRWQYRLTAPGEQLGLWDDLADGAEVAW